MNINLKEITVRELTKDYVDNQVAGVVGYGGLLDIRPAYQREFIYSGKQRDLVLDTVKKNYPLNVMYWAVRGDGTFEVIDGQQRTISICQYVSNDFSIKGKLFSNLTVNEQDEILDYKITVYLCDGTDSEKLEWFKTINIAGEKLKAQELRNAVYTGAWLTDAKRHFSKNGCVAYNLGKDYVKGSPINQEILETVLKWISGNDIEDYMSKHQHDLDAKPLWDYFEKVINWVMNTFPIYREEMKGLPWGDMYNAFHGSTLCPVQLEAEIDKLMQDAEVTKQKGIYEYVLTRDEKYLNLRQFEDSHRRRFFTKQKGVCPICSETFVIGDMQADHITPWSQGGKTNDSNCQMLCKPCNQKKGATPHPVPVTVK